MADLVWERLGSCIHKQQAALEAAPKLPAAER